MKKNKRLTREGQSRRRSGAGSATGTRQKRRRKKGLTLSASAEHSKGNTVSMEEVMEFYKPIKKPITLRLDADVLAWFRRDGRRYQTRINGALRRVMEREMKE
jgi:uncharacterized protein (DUF4415 family)